MSFKSGRVVEIDNLPMKKVLADVELTDAEQTITVSGKAWSIDTLIISNVTAATTGVITLKFNDNGHFTNYEVAANAVFPVNFPYVLEVGETFKYSATANSVVRVAVIGTEEV